MKFYFLRHSHRAVITVSTLLSFTILTYNLSAVAQLIFPRQNINVFMTQPARIAALKRGIQVMKQRPASDPTSWTFQSRVHGTVLSGANWNKCQHQHWWFLAWHRAYLYYMERMLQKAANEPRLRIPYWNYTATNSRSLPAPFLDPTSPLYVPGRNLVSATDQVTPSAVNTSNAMSRIAFIGSDAQLGFGGGRENTPIQFPFTDKSGSLEVVPHNAIHDQVGGLMQNSSTAATDPIFWLHHSNIDRLWVNWLASDQGRANPTDPTFLNATFSLYNENGVLVTRHVSDFIGNTTALGYYYDDSPPPAQPAIASAATQTQQIAEDAEAAASKMTFTTIGETTAAESKPILIQPVSFPVTINMQLPAAQALARRTPSLGHEPCRYLLVLDDIDFAKPPANIYQIYLNQPESTIDTSIDTPNYIGVLTFFEPYPMNKNHHAAKRSNTFDITSNIQSLQQDPKFDPSKLIVTLVPIGIMKQGKPTLPDNPVAIKIKTFKIVVGEGCPKSSNQPAGKT